VIPAAAPEKIPLDLPQDMGSSPSAATRAGVLVRRPMTWQSRANSSRKASSDSIPRRGPRSGKREHLPALVQVATARPYTLPAAPHRGSPAAPGLLSEARTIKAGISLKDDCAR